MPGQLAWNWFGGVGLLAGWLAGWLAGDWTGGVGLLADVRCFLSTWINTNHGTSYLQDRKNKYLRKTLTISSKTLFSWNPWFWNNLRHFCIKDTNVPLKYTDIIIISFGLKYWKIKYVEYRWPTGGYRRLPVWETVTYWWLSVTIATRHFSPIWHVWHVFETFRGRSWNLMESVRNDWKYFLKYW